MQLSSHTSGNLANSISSWYMDLSLVRGMNKWVNTAPEAAAAEHRKNAPLVPRLLITRGKAWEGFVWIVDTQNICNV